MTRAALARLLQRGLAELDLAARVTSALPAGPLPARIVAVGKAAPAMAAGAIARWGQAIESCLVVAPDATSIAALAAAAKRGGIERRLRVLRASHPVPDARSVRAARACLEAVASAAPRRVLVLVSGGASALVCAPAAGVSLADKRAVTRALLASGAPVRDLNVVRKHLSRIKGGGLLHAAGTNAVHTLIASDVIGGTAADVGSGPTMPDVSTAAEARRILRRYAPELATLPLQRALAHRSAPAARDPDPASVRASRSRVEIVASPEAITVAIARLLREAGHAVHVLAPSQASADELASEYIARAARAPQVFVRVAEPSVPVPSRAGRGGRCTHLAALVAQGLLPQQRVLFAAFASDGVDGRSGTGGAIVDERVASRARRSLGEGALAAALATFDTGTLHRALGTALAEAPSGHNLADVHVLVVQ